MNGSAGRPAARVLRGLFDVTLLLALREKEIGLAADASMARARALLSRLPGDGISTRRGLEDFETLLKAAEAVAGDSSGFDAEERAKREGRPQQDAMSGATAALIHEDLHKLAATDLVAAYLVLALDCGAPGNRPPTRPAADAAFGDLALMRYRLAICSNGQPVPLRRLREEDPRWMEILYFEGKYEMGTPARSAEPVRAAALLMRAAEAFPESLAVHMMLARAQEMRGEFVAALASFDQVLALKPMHVDAQLGRVRNLSYLGRANEGITVATALIDLGMWHVSDGFYWRAWNQYQARRFESAWADVQDAMRLLANTSVYALAGSIAYARKDLDTAVHHFDRALEMDSTNCAAASSAGLVHIDRRAWQAAAEMYAKATNCFALAANTARADLARLEQSALEPTLQATRLSSAQKRIESAEALSGQSALMAAQSYIHASQKSLALKYIELAERHTASRAEALALKARIDSIQ